VIGVSVFRRPSATFEGRRYGHGLEGSLGANVLGQEIGVLAEAVAGAFDLDDDGVVEQAVEQRRGYYGIAEDLAPFGEAAIGG